MSIAFRVNGDLLLVYLDAKRVGSIKKVTGGWQYFPKGAKQLGGEVFPTLRACQNSLYKE